MFHRVIHAAILTAVLALGCQPVAGHGAGDAQRAAPEKRVTYASLVADADRRIAALSARAEKRPTDWLTREHLGAVLLERAGLTASFDDYTRLERVVDEAMAIAPEGSGPLLLAARFNYAIHRLERAEEYLDRMEDRVMQKSADAVASRLLRAQIAFQRGQYAESLAGLHEVAAVMPEAARNDLALYHAKTGGAAEAAALYEQALASPGADARSRAWLRMQLGILAMDHGRYDEALASLRAADEELPGWWLVEEHIAAAEALLGHDDEAATLYAAVLRDSGLPQYMDALAGCYARLNRIGEARALVDQAGAAWDKNLALFPEAAGGHGLSHYLEYGTADRALDLARANATTRPGGDAQVLLARAYLKAGRPEQALAVIDAALATPYRTAALHDVARQAHHALNQAAEEKAQRALCLIQNPRSCTGEGFAHSH